MEPSSDSVTVFRSADTSAEEEAADVCEVLVAAGLNPEVLDDDAPEVPPGSFVVRVPASQESAAEAALTAARNAPEVPVDNSHSLDMVIVFEGMGTTAEIEALGIRGVLEANGIPSVIAATSQYPNLPYLVQVPRQHYEAAKAAIAEAQQSGPEAAEEAEKATEI